MKQHYGFVGIILMVSYILAGCRHPADDIFNAAESLMAEQPDSAMQILTSLPESMLESERDKAIRTILLAEARYKSGYDDTVDSAISNAAKYFDQDKKNRYRLKAFYHKGIININSRNYGDALISLLFAEESAKALNDTLASALVHRSMGDAFSKLQNYSTATAYYKISYEEFHSIPGCAYLPDAMYDLSRSYFNDNKYDSCLLIGKELLDYAEPRNLSRFLRIQYILNGKVLLEKKDYEKAIEAFTKGLHHRSNSNVQDAIENLGIAYLDNHDIISAEECNQELINNGRENSWLSYRIAFEKQDYKEAIYSLQERINNANKNYYEWLSRRQEKDLFNKYILLSENSRLQIESSKGWLWFWIISGIMAFILLFGLYFYYRYTQKKNECELNKKIAIIQRLESELELNEIKVKESVKNQFALLNKLVVKYYSCYEENEKKSKIYKEIKDTIIDIQSNKEVYKSLVKTVNDKLGNLMNDFLTDFPNLQPWEPDLFLFTVLGFSSNAISIFQGISPETINNRKTSLRKKILRSGKDSTERYLKFLGGRDTNKSVNKSAQTPLS